MKQSLTSALAICAVLGLAAPALADCQEELTQMRAEAQSESGGGIAKDGSLAPLEGEADQSAGAEAEQEEGASASATDQSESADADNEIVKDGDVAPLEADTSTVATSGQDAAAQQEGDAASADASTDTSAGASSDTSASADASGGSMSQEAQDALTRAETALAAGDEAGCMEAVEEARSL